MAAMKPWYSLAFFGVIVLGCALQPRLLPTTTCSSVGNFEALVDSLRLPDPSSNWQELTKQRLLDASLFPPVRDEGDFVTFGEPASQCQCCVIARFRGGVLESLRLVQIVRDRDDADDLARTVLGRMTPSSAVKDQVIADLNHQLAKGDAMLRWNLPPTPATRRQMGMDTYVTRVDRGAYLVGIQLTLFAVDDVR